MAVIKYGVQWNSLRGRQETEPIIELAPSTDRLQQPLPRGATVYSATVHASGREEEWRGVGKERFGGRMYHFILYSTLWEQA